MLGTVTASARIGDVLLSSIPGEAYPQIALEVADRVKVRGHMTAGLAQDQLGYLIAPYQAYPEPIRRSFFNQRGDEVSPIDNDNYFFNVSHTMGERVTCSLLRGAGEVFGRGTSLRDARGGLHPVRERLAAGGGRRHRALAGRRNAATMPGLGEVAQLVEHTTENRGVAGSIPALATPLVERSSERVGWQGGRRRPPRQQPTVLA